MVCRPANHGEELAGTGANMITGESVTNDATRVVAAATGDDRDDAPGVYADLDVVRTLDAVGVPVRPDVQRVDVLVALVAGEVLSRWPQYHPRPLPAARRGVNEWLFSAHAARLSMMAWRLASTASASDIRSENHSRP